MKEIKVLRLVLFTLALTIGVGAHAQTPVKVQRAELSIPFGVVKGKLIAANDLMIFVDEENTDASFTIEKASIKGWNEQDGVITIDTSKPIKDRSGERTRLAFRLTDGNGAALAAWYKNSAAGMTTATTNGEAKTAAVTAPAPASSDMSGTKVYQATQKRFPIGSTDGKLIISETEIAFESLNDIKRSQRWSYRDIKEIKQISTYIIEVAPFRGDKYKLELQGEGMSSAQFKILTDRIASARVAK